MAFDRDAYNQRREREIAEVQAELREQNRAHWIQVCREMSEMVPEFAERRLDNYRPKTELQRKALTYCHAIVAGDVPPAMYLHGLETGVGKTHLAGGIVNSAIERGIPAVFTTGVALLQRIRASYSRNGSLREGERDIIDRLAGVKVLVLDDLGTEPFTADTARLFYLLLNQRDERRLPLIVTSNLSLADLGVAWMSSGVEAHLGNKIIDRIRGRCGQQFYLDGESQRGKTA